MCWYLALKPAKRYPGDGGSRVNIPSDLQEKSKETFKINQFNLVASDLMTLNRTLPDYRSSELVAYGSLCTSMQYILTEISV